MRSVNASDAQRKPNSCFRLTATLAEGILPILTACLCGITCTRNEQPPTTSTTAIVIRVGEVRHVGSLISQEHADGLAQYALVIGPPGLGVEVRLPQGAEPAEVVLPGGPHKHVPWGGVWMIPSEDAVELVRIGDMTEELAMMHWALREEHLKGLVRKSM